MDSQRALTRSTNTQTGQKNDHKMIRFAHLQCLNGFRSLINRFFRAIVAILVACCFYLSNPSTMMQGMNTRRTIRKQQQYTGFNNSLPMGKKNQETSKTKENKKRNNEDEKENPPAKKPHSPSTSSPTLPSLAELKISNEKPKSLTWKGHKINSKVVLKEYITHYEEINSEYLNNKFGPEALTKMIVERFEKQYEGVVEKSDEKHILEALIKFDTEEDDEIYKWHAADQKGKCRIIMKDLLKIRVPKCGTINPNCLQRPFVTGFSVVLAYLATNMNENPDAITDRREIMVYDNIEEIAKELNASGFTYPNRFNKHYDANHHVIKAAKIGQFLRNQREKARKYGVWSYNEETNEIIGDTKGLYAEYKELFDRIGIRITRKN